MLPEYRRQRIHEIVTEHGRSSVAELARVLGVSQMTVRRDLERLAAHKAVRRIHGGAIATDDEQRIGDGLIVDEHTRRRFDSLAAEHIEDGSVLMWRALEALVGDGQIRVIARPTIAPDGEFRG